MEYLPKGANFKRGKIFWELGLHIAGNPATKYGGNRDLCIVVGSGSGEDFKPWLRLSTGSAITAMVPLSLDSEAFAQLRPLGRPRVPLKAGRFSYIDRECDCVDFSGWPLYAAASLPDQVAYDVCSVFGARHDEMLWEEGTHQGISDIGKETDATPMVVPLHPGTERWYSEQGHIG